MEFMNGKEVLDYYKRKGITLWSDNGKLKYKAPQSLLSEENILLLKKYKEMIMEYLERRKEDIKVVINKNSRFDPFPMTDVQTAYLLGRNNTFQYGGVACHVYLEIKYDELNLERVKGVFKKLIERHDMLRAVMNKNGYQQIFKVVEELEVPYFDMTKGDIKEAKKFHNFIEKMSTKLYELDKWPMFGIAISKHDEGTILHFSMEFLIADWTSIWLLLSEFESLYFTPDKKLPDFELSFRDYILAERKLKESDAYKEDKEYWLKQIEKFPLAPELPLKKMSKTKNKPIFKRNLLNMSLKNWNSFKSNAQKFGVTPTVAVLTVYADVIERWSRNKKFCINLTVLNRFPLHEDIGRIVGDFTSVSLLSVDESKKERFIERAKAINSKLFEDLDHRLYTGIEVIRELSRKKGREASLMPIVFTSAIGLVKSNNQLIGKFEGRGITQTPQVFIDCQAMDGNFGLQINWDVRDGIFPDGMVEDMFEEFRARLNELAISIDSWHNAKSINIPQWQKNEREEVNNTKTDISKGMLYSKFIEQVKIRPNQMAIDDGKGCFTYEELNNMAKAIAFQIMKHGGKKQDKIAIVMEKSRYQVAAVLGVLYMGGVYVPIDANNAEERRNTILKNVGSNIMLTISNTKNTYKQNICTINVDTIPIIIDDSCIVENDSTNPAYIIYTSGSTGMPKGVVINHDAALNTIEDINNKFQINFNDKILGISQLNFDLSVFDIFGMLSVGGGIIYPQHYMDPDHWLELIEKYHITIWNSVPALMKILLTNFESKNIKSLIPLRLALLSGDWIPMDMPDKLIKQIPKIEVICLGGATEASIWSIYHKYERLKERRGGSIPYGKPLSNQEFCILDEKLNNCPVWVSGHIYISGNGLALEYYDDSKMTDLKFFRHPVTGKRIYKTGDIGRYLPGGEIEFIGREDNQVKLRGQRIELGEIEHAINNHPSVELSVAFVNSDENEICAVVEPKLIKEYDSKIADNRFEKLTCNIESAAYEAIEKLKTVDFNKALQARDKASLISILYCFQQFGLLKDERYYHIDELLYCDKIKEKYRWIILPWILSLEKGGLINKKENKLYQAQINITEEYQIKMWEEARKNWVDELGSVEIIDYIKLNAINLPKILNGSVDPLGLLYPNGDNRFTKALYVKNTMTTYLNKCICEFVKRFAEKNKNKKIRILEIGAGTGATTEYVLESLKGFNFEYYFTDATKYFFSNARKKFGDKKEVVIKALDIDKDCFEQGFVSNSFDIVIGSYVLENAKNIEKSIDRIEDLLMPQGYFLFSSPIKDEVWLLASQALMMTIPEDELRNRAAFIEQDDWLEILKLHGDNKVSKVIPEKNSNLACLGLNLFIKQFKRKKKKVDIDDIKKYISLYLPDYMVPTTINFMDKLPLNSNNKVHRDRVIQWSESIAAMDTVEEDVDDLSNELEIKLGDIWSEYLKVDRIGKKQNFYDFGADSLIMAQVATKIRNKMKVNIPFETILRQMLNHPTIGELEQFILEEEKKERGKNILDKEYPEKSIEKEEFVNIRNYGGDENKRIRVIIKGALGAMDILQYLAEELVDQGKGKVISIGVLDIRRYCSLNPTKIVPFLAEQYTNSLMKMNVKKVQLIGYCFGGIVSVEIAKRLIEKGVEVEDVSIIDGGSIPVQIYDDLVYELLFLEKIYIPLSDLGFKKKEMVEKIFEKLIDTNKKVITVNDFNIAQSDNSLNSVFESLKNKTQKERFEVYKKLSEKNTGNKIDINVIKESLKVFIQSFKALHFVPEAYFGDIRYFSSKEREGLYRYFEALLSRWENVCLGDFSVKKVEGNHDSCVSKRENSVELAQLIGEIYK